MRRVKLYVLQQERIRSFLLIAQHPEAVLLYQGTCGNVEALQHLSGWEFCVSETSSPLYRLHKKEIIPGFQCVIIVDEQPVHFYAEDAGAQAFHYEGYALQDIVRIGRSSLMELCIQKRGVSRCHASLQRTDAGWELVDENSTNGCYVNGRRIQKAVVTAGDVLYLGVVALVMGKDSVFVPLQSAVTQLSACRYSAAVSEQTQVRCPGLRLIPTPAPGLSIELELPLPKASQENLPAVFILGPSITMGLSSTAMGLFSFWLAAERNQDLMSVIPTLLMSVSMALGTILWPILSKRYERKQQRRKEEKRCYVYSCYLLEIRERIQQAVKEETQYLKRWYPGAAQLCDEVLANQENHLRSCDKPGWLQIVLGHGRCTAGIQLHLPQISSMTQDVLIEKLQALHASEWMLENVPIVADLQTIGSLCLQGKRDLCIDTLLNLLLQLVIEQPAQKTRICIVADRELLSNEKLLCLPHLFANEQRLLAWNRQHAIRCIQQIKQIVEDAAVQDVVLCILEPGLVDTGQLPRHEKVHVLRWSDTLNNAADLVLDITDSNVSWPQRHAEFKLDSCSVKKRRTAFLRCSAQLPSAVFAQGNQPLSFLELFHCRRVEELQIASRCAASDAAKSLRARIGQNADGGLLYLDAHEHAHGPHGLLAGMTGSGKSECLLTYLLSLAVTFSCQDVSFLLIDFKGGTMANALSQLPHTAGIITNLDKGILLRCLCAIEGELTRRQKQLAETGEKLHISSMDIDKYMRLRKQDSSLPAMPHLFLVADEFAELKQLFPAVLDHLRQCARIGRSLGIHLLLATQKPFGVVDEQIWSNARFHLCLKVADRNDSMDMLKKEDAIHLQHPGQLFLQVGQDEVFLQGQSAWTQAPYDPQHTQASIQGLTYRDSEGAAQHMQLASSSVSKTELEAVCDALCDMKQERAAALWLPPLKADLCQEELPEGNAELILGLIDDIAHQQQIPFRISLNSARNFAVCGMVGSGKGLFVETLIQSCLQHDACILYLFDFDKPLFMKYASYHQTAAVFQREDTERVLSFFSFMKRMIKHRRTHAAGESILCILHNYEVFHELYQEYEEKLLYLLREGKKYGIVFCITTSAMHQIPMRIQSCIENWYALQCAQHEDYSYLFPGEQRCIPLAQKGCGLMKYNDEVCMFQIAAFQTAAWTKASKRPTSAAYLVLTRPDHVAHSLYMEDNESFLGIDIRQQEEVCYSYPKGRCLFLLAAYQLCGSFITLFLKQLDIDGRVHIFSPCEIGGKKPSVKAELSTLLESREEQYVVWHQLDQQDIEDTLMQNVLEHRLLHHIFIETMPHLNAYTQWSWYAPIWLEADVLWMGKGFQEHSYALKKNVVTDVVLKRNEALYWEEDACRILQLWEVEENG